jgi:hypothetical protein
MSLPPLFGATWEEFLENWCLGNVPSDHPETVASALSTLCRLWPDRVAAMAGKGLRGLMVVSPAVENGLVLSACESLHGFQNVLRRLKTGEKSAYAELTFAARLIRAGFTPTLEPPLGSGSLDTLVPLDEGPVYCEVKAPETSEAIEDIKAAAARLAGILRDQNPGKRVEVLFTDDIDETAASKVAAAVRLHPMSDSVWFFNTTALISTKLMGDDPNVGPTIPSPEAAAIIGAAQGSLVNGVRTAGIVRVPVTDARAKRLLYGESHHFSRDHMNLLVMDVSNCVTSLKAWEKLIENCLQPTQNRRFGAVILYFAGVGGDKMTPRQEWRVIRNPYAYKPLPEALLEGIGNPDARGAFG